MTQTPEFVKALSLVVTTFLSWALGGCTGGPPAPAQTAPPVALSQPWR